MPWPIEPTTGHATNAFTMKWFARLCQWTSPVWASFRQAKIDKHFSPGRDRELPLVFLEQLLIESSTTIDTLSLLFHFLAVARSRKDLDLLSKLLKATRAFPPECDDSIQPSSLR
jgi:hypothetical protein